MRVLITGGAGYIGSVLTQYLLECGYDVTVYDRLLFGGNGLLSSWNRKGFKFVRGDVRDLDLLVSTAQDCDVVVWLAALVGEPACNKNQQETYQVNFEAVSNAAGQLGTRPFFFASTCSNYGINENELATEDTPVNPVSCYSETKVMAETALRGRATILRFATAYGISPRMRFDLLLNEWVKDAVTKNYISVYGAKSFRPFVHVRDIARAVEFCIARKIEPQILNVGGENWSKQKLAEAAATFETKIALAEGKSDPRNYRVSFERLSKLGYVTFYAVGDGIREITRAIQDGVIVDPYSGIYSNA